MSSLFSVTVRYLMQINELRGLYEDKISPFTSTQSFQNLSVRNNLSMYQLHFLNSAELIIRDIIRKKTVNMTMKKGGLYINITLLILVLIQLKQQPECFRMLPNCCVSKYLLSGVPLLTS